jgi:trimethylamine--corrinoid protein Co-methyltransferase
MMIDAQAGAESAFSVLSQGLAGLNLIHDVGYLGAGMICSPEMLVMGDEICGMTRHLLRGITVNAETLAVDAIDNVGPGGNFVQSEHTFRHFREETWFPKLMERNYYDTWVASGKPSTQDRIRDKLAEIVENHQPVPLGDHERSELERLREEGEEVLGKAH